MAIEGVDDFRPHFSERWRHGGWYVGNVRYPSGAVGCVSNNYTDKLWRMACHRPELTFSTRADAAKAEKILVDGLHERARLLAAIEDILAKMPFGANWDSDGGNPQWLKNARDVVAKAKGGV